MDAWITFWGLLLIAVVAIFAMVAAVVTIGGFFDVKALFQNIDEQHDHDPASPPPSRENGSSEDEASSDSEEESS